MVPADDLVAFLMKAAATVVRIDRCFGPDEEVFRQLVIGDMVDGIPLVDPWAGLQGRLGCGEDAVVAVSHAFAEQAAAYSEAAARATVAIVEQAVGHLHALGGDKAVVVFLDGLQRQEGDPAT